MLSKETTDQIRKEAEEKFNPYSPTYNTYVLGCQTWAVWKEKADAAEVALRWYKNQAELAKATRDTDSLLSIVTALQLDGGSRATKALEQWK